MSTQCPTLRFLWLLMTFALVARLHKRPWPVDVSVQYLPLKLQINVLTLLLSIWFYALVGYLCGKMGTEYKMHDFRTRRPTLYCGRPTDWVNVFYLFITFLRVRGGAEGRGTYWEINYYYIVYNQNSFKACRKCVCGRNFSNCHCSE